MLTTPKPISTTRRDLIKTAALALAGAAVANTAVARSARADSVSDRLDALLQRGLVEDSTQVEEPVVEESAAGVPNTYKQLFCSLLDEEGIKYADIDDYTMRIGYWGDYLESIDIMFAFDEENDPYVHMMCWSIGNVGERIDDGLRACNQMNYDYYWAKFYIDNDNDIVVNLDCIVDEQTCAQELREMLSRAVSIVDNSYNEAFSAVVG